MKPKYFFAISLVLGLLIFSSIAYSQIILDTDYSIPWEPTTPNDPQQFEKERQRKEYRCCCWCLFHQRCEPCTFEAEMEIGDFPDCVPAPNKPCGHIGIEHTTDKPEFPEVAGGLVDEYYYENLTFHLPARTQQTYYSFDFLNSQLMSKVKIKIIASGLPMPHFFVTPCESGFRCTGYQTLELGRKDLMELEAPQDSNPNYLRCGKISECKTADDPPKPKDDPYSWKAHRTIHWGTKMLIDKLKRLAMIWKIKCDNPLVITDMSLPGGGLLDCGEKPDFLINWDTPHYSHRHGTDADLVKYSVPIPHGEIDCGEIPGKDGTYDKKWKSDKNPLWNPPLYMAARVGFTYPTKEKYPYLPSDDPGHLCLKKSENVCQ